MRSLQIVFVLLLLFFVSAAKAQEYTQAQDKVKSLYVYNFIKDIIWSSYTISGEVNVCVLGRTELFEEVRKISSRQVNGRTIAVNQVSGLSGCVRCDMIFVEENARIDSKKEKDCRSLIVTDGFFDKALSNVVLMFKDQRLQFSVNQELCDKQGYKVSSHLISLSNRDLIK